MRMARSRWAAARCWRAAIIRSDRASFPKLRCAICAVRIVLPGFVDTHMHFPQVRVIGGLGYSLLDWLDQLTLPEEVRFADAGYAAMIAGEFVRQLASHGTTTALVFGAHFVDATAALFDAAGRAGLRVIGGLVLADRLLREELHSTPEAAWRELPRFDGSRAAAARGWGMR